MRSRQVLRCCECGLPTPLCLCAELPRVRVRTRVVVLMSRSEAVRTSNTGRLAVRLLEGSARHVSGTPATPGWPELETGSRAVLFPFPGAPILGDGTAAPDVLLVPDGSWSQARRSAIKAVRELAIPAVALPPMAGGLEGLRRRPSETSLCTFEAIARALSILEGSAVAEQMMPALRLFVERSRLARTRGYR
jgi:DTW domain-containing protein